MTPGIFTMPGVFCHVPSRILYVFWHNANRRKLMTPGFSGLRKYFLGICAFLITLPTAAIGQTYTDGPIQLQVTVRDINTTFNQTDQGLLGVGFTPDELTYHIWARDAANLDGSNWVGGSCLTDDFSPPTQSMDFNTTIFNFAYPGANVPQFIDLRVDAWEDDLPSDGLAGFCNTGNRCTFQNPQCCGVVVFGTCIGITTGDDFHCDANPFLTGLDYRQGPPCQTYNHGYVVGSCPSNNNYQPRIETFWRYIRGTSCGNAIQLGSVSPGFSTISHFNSNECYSNNFTTSPGNDVFYEFTVSQSVGVEISLCAAATFNTNLYLLDNTCTQIAFNNNFCANTSQINFPICNPGTYYVVVDGNGAGDFGTFTLSIDEDPTVLPTADAGPAIAAICQGNSIFIGGSPSATGGVSPYTYSWTPGTGLSATNVANPQAFPLVTTQYFLTVTDQNNCTHTDSITINSNPGPPISLGPSQTVCPNTPVTLNPGGPYITYFWSNGATTQTITVTQPSQYHVTVIDLNGCLSKDTVDIFNHPQPALNLGPDTSICTGASLTLDGGSAVSWNWSTGGTTQFVTVNSAGQYDVTIQDVNGCNTSDTINVGIDPLPTVSLGNDTTVCPGDFATMDPGPGFSAYSWNTGSSNQAINATNPGAYTVTVTDANGCQNSDTKNLFNHTAPAVNLGPDQQICAGSAATLNAGVGFNSYQWNTGATTSSINVFFPGTYWVDIVDGNNCTASDTINVTVNPLPTISLGNDTSICSGANLTLDAGPGWNAQTWSTAASTQTINVNTAGTYWVEVTDGNNCQNRDTIIVGIDPNPVVNLGVDTTICPGDFITVDAGSGYVAYNWNTGSGNQLINVTAAQLYSVTVTDANGCQGTDSKNIFNHPQATVNLGPDTNVCIGGTHMLDAGAGFVNYSWFNGDTNQTIQVNFPGLYSVVVTDGNTCQATDTVQVTAFPQPIVNLGRDTVICSGGNITLDAGSGWSNIVWSNGTVLQTIQVNTSGLYYVDVTDANGCTASDSILVIIDTPLMVDLGPNITFCDSGSVILDAGAGLTSYLWNTGSVNQFLFVSDPGTYSVTVTNQYGCSAFDSVTVDTSGQAIGIFLGPDTVKCSDTDILLDAGDQFVAYEWDNGSFDQYRIITSPGTYIVTVTDQFGCRYTDMIDVVQDSTIPVDLGPDRTICPDKQIELEAPAGFDRYLWSTGAETETILVQAGSYSVTVWSNDCAASDFITIRDTNGEHCQKDLWIPNAFTPNGDFLNDEWQIIGVSLTDYEIRVFNEWNQLMYQSSDVNRAWDGSFRGQKLPEGVYTYRIVYRIAGDEELQTERGTVTLIR